MSEDTIPFLKVHPFFAGLSDEILKDVAQFAALAHFEPGQCVQPINKPVTRIGFVIRGRIEAVYIDRHGNESLFKVFKRGDQLGFVVASLGEPVPLRLDAVEPTTVIQLDYEDALELTFKHRELRRSWTKNFSQSLRDEFFKDKRQQRLTIASFLHGSDSTRSLIPQLVNRLTELGEKPGVFSDYAGWQQANVERYRCALDEGKIISREEFHRQVGQWTDSKRIIIDLSGDLEAEDARRMFEVSDRVFWCCEPSQADSMIKQLRSIEAHAPRWREKISVVWLLKEGRVSPRLPEMNEVAIRDFKISSAEITPPAGRAMSFGLERLVHFMRNVQIGVALGGGAARGMAHLGVLKVFENNGIVVDQLAGTSAGAMTGIIYASGMDPDYSAGRFSADLRPGMLYRMLPHGGYWYLLSKFRRGKFDQMLRRYLEDWTLEQLPIPCRAVTVDLVGGGAVVREQGDAVHSILESINLPVLSSPICRNGQALVDGGLVKNIPADVLVANGCNFVIAVSVTAKMEHEFGHNRPDTPTPKMKAPSTLQTVMRSLLVQSHNMNAFGVQPADVIIEPDVTGIELSEFTRTKELAAIGAETAGRHIEKIKDVLHKIDSDLFPKTGEESGSAG